MSEAWDTADAPETRARQIVAGVIRLAQNDEACRLLGVDGTLEDEVDVSFLNDPLAWIANEIAGAVRTDEDDEEEVVSLSTLVALVRLYRILQGGVLDESALVDAVVEYLGEDEDD
jgi:hypothetical protein